MAQRLNLGESTLQIRDSKLQLRLTASAHFSQPPSHRTPQIPIELLHLSNIRSVWITEAPELELRFSIGGDWDRNEAGAFVSKLRGNLCDMEIWSDVGFSVEPKTSARECCVDPSGFHCLEFGLRRECKMRNHTTGRTLPSSMANPPDACPPTGVPIATLASIHIRLEYILQPKIVSSVREYSKLDIGCLRRESSASQAPRLLGAMPGVSIPQHECPSETPGSQNRMFGDRSYSSHEELHRLFGVGIEHLVTSNLVKDTTIRVSSRQIMIKSLVDFSPAVFDPRYRDAMNQRGVTIPIITKAISSMLAGKNDPSIKAKLSHLLERSRSRHIDDTIIQPEALSCKAAVLSSLWRIAQTTMPRIKPIKRGASMVSTERLSKGPVVPDEAVRHISKDQLQRESRKSGLLCSTQTLICDENEESDVCLLNSESDEQLLDNLSDTGFSDIGESTQTSIHTSFSTIGSSQTSYDDHDSMLLSDHDELVDDLGNHMIDHDPLESMEAYDVDIIMAHDL
ncbi:uncharacterized protein N7500_010918 [Penicillium coprophilum]|uniref:uncharacterized protein n=1 Tax=Penicillium coprophilum TaxID=36646 RepID=UPI00238F795E|nr:uncharacterized protein N7500_010918 [Penicillium coprophilum]KAJ5150729.1 hypothetical protein N7500_010918 [Penicillium coprophilum]